MRGRAKGKDVRRKTKKETSHMCLVQGLHLGYLGVQE